MRIGIDFGGTQIKVAAVRQGEIKKSVRLDTPQGKEPQAVLAAIVEAVRQLDVEPTTVGLAIPGHVDNLGMIWRLPNVPGFEGVKIAEHLSTELGCDVAVENDATTAALGENLWGRGRGFETFLMVTLGTGVGGGLIVNNTLVRGTHGFTGEIGHMRIDWSDGAWPCGCGRTGCVEAYAGTRGLVRKYRELGGEAERIRDIAEAARRREAAALEVFTHLGRTVGLMVVNVQNLLDLEAVVFSGGVSGSFDLFEPVVHDTIRRESFAPPLGQIPLLVSKLGSQAGQIGAAYLSSLRRNPESVLERS